MTMRQFRSVAVIIPTYKRSGSLLRAIRSLQDQALDDFEIVVVDNAVDRELQRIVEGFNHTARVKAKYIPEARLGLHNARHTGARTAKGDILVFSDDDATFDPVWLKAYAKTFAKHPEMVAAGGAVRPVWEAPPPHWLLEYMGEPKCFTFLSLLEPYQEFHLGHNVGFFGVNMAIRRDILFLMGGFNPESFGDIWLGDGESGLNRRLWRAGMLVGYVPDAVVYHHIPASRMTVAYFRKRMANEGACDAYAKYHPGIPSRFELAEDILRIALHNARYWLLALALWGQTTRKALNVQLRAARSWSHVCYILRLMRDPALRDLVTKSDWLKAT